MPEFIIKDMGGTEVYACVSCPQDDSDHGEPNHRNIKGKLDCGHEHEIEPRPTGIPKRVPCPGDIDGGAGGGTEGSADPELFDIKELMCTHCEDGAWHPVT